MRTQGSNPKVAPIGLGDEATLLKMLDLFSGIGGFSLAAEWTGAIETVAFCEIDPFCQKVLKKHWPDVPVFDDVKELDFTQFKGIDLVSAGFPCQDLSLAGQGEGLEGERSGLWREVARCVREASPRYLVVENVPALLIRGMGDVLSDLASCGYDAEWDCLPASAFGAYHERDRLFIVAYPQSKHRESRRVLETSRRQQAQLQSRRFHSMAVATGGATPGKRLECEPDLVRLVPRIPDRTHRLEGLGNSIYPEAASFILKAIVEIEETA